jgi:alpha-beta hydrolase superfamily lysophospholipase
MKKFLKWVLYTLLFLVLAIIALAYWPVSTRIPNKGITPAEAARLRRQYTAPHDTFTTTDGLTLFLRRWNPPHIDSAKKDIAVLIFHGFTAYSGPYAMAGEPISAGGYTVFGLDYRGHGMSDGNRGDSPGRARFIADLGQSVKYVKSLGFKRVVVLGHSLGVAMAMCAADTVPNDVAGLILLSGAYEGRKGLSKPVPFLKQAHILVSSIIRPSYPAVEYYRDGMTVSKDTLFNFRYTLRFLTMMDVKKLRLPKDMNIPVLVGVGDHDELFEVDKVKDFYNLIPGDKKTFFIMKNATHARIPRDDWEEIVTWLDKTYVK